MKNEILRYFVPQNDTLGIERISKLVWKENRRGKGDRVIYFDVNDDCPRIESQSKGCPRSDKIRIKLRDRTTLCSGSKQPAPVSTP